MNVKGRTKYGFNGFVLLLFLGLIYAWSIFVSPLETEFGWVRIQTSMIFTITMVCFCLGSLFSGRVTAKKGARVTIRLAAGLLLIGFIGSANVNSLPGIFITYGVICGSAVGMGYNCILSTTLKWFAERAGMVSGLLLMGFGFGSMALGAGVTSMIGAFGWRMTFVILGVVFAVLLFVGSILLVPPSKEFSEALLKKQQHKAGPSAPLKDFTPAQMLKTSNFWIALLWNLLLTAGGLALISNAVPAAREILLRSMDASAALILATTAMGMLSMASGVGRLIVGMVWDKKGYRFTLVFVALLLTLSMVMLIFADKTDNFALLVTGFFLLGFAYGGGPSSASALIMAFFGPKYYGQNYSIITCNMILSAVIGPTVISSLQAATGTYGSAYIVFLFFGFATLAGAFMIKSPQ
jgi:OFA family oxalate/formate antiporter-like MFS transporter